MKIGLIGNMNNNNFAIMRYFRDLGADAHLLLFQNDGQGAQSHFRPENDTWDIKKWEPYIHQSSLIDGVISLLGDPRRLKFPVSSKKIRQELSGYDKYIGSGYTPALLTKAGLKPDIFYPYAIGVEGAGTQGIRKYMDHEVWYKKLLMRYPQRQQIAGIRNSKYCLTTEWGLSFQTFNEINVKVTPLDIPMVYNESNEYTGGQSLHIESLKTSIKNYDLIILSHARHLWVNKGYFSNNLENHRKENDWLIRGYAKFKTHKVGVKSLLILLEYGEDVEASKKLVNELGINESVLWLPIMTRKELLYLLTLCHIGVGEFGLMNTMWGGTGWEVLSSGLPLMQTVNLTTDQFREKLGYEMPPILNVRSPTDITYYLEDYIRDQDKYKAIGVRSKEWFDTYNGHGLAQKWLNLLSS